MEFKDWCRTARFAAAIHLTGAGKIPTITAMADLNPNVVSVESSAAKLSDGVVDLGMLEGSDPVSGCTVFTHYNGPTDQLSGLCAGMCVLDPGRARIRRTSIPKRSS